MTETPSFLYAELTEPPMDGPAGTRSVLLSEETGEMRFCGNLFHGNVGTDTTEASPTFNVSQMRYDTTVDEIDATKQRKK